MLYVAVVSHRHADTIQSLDCLGTLAKHLNIQVVIKDNVGEAGLAAYCDAHGVEYYDASQGLGFGANNNHIFDYLTPRMNDSDYFLVLNPDVMVDAEVLFRLIAVMEDKAARLATINLYRDAEFVVHDNSVRRFPTLTDFFGSYVGLKNNTIIDKTVIDTPTFVDWSAGSFLMFRVDLYRKLHGFNQRYFMYCEDVDICWRAKTLYAERVLFVPDLKAMHQAQFNNRRFFSRHFLWHVSSAFRFLFYRYGLIGIPHGEISDKVGQA